jgi:anti-sigma factor ChrR (cupin superfamily)
MSSLAPVAEILAGALPPLPPPPRIRAALLQQITTIRPGDPEPPARPPLVIHRAFESVWEDTPLPGVRQRVLHRDPQRRQVTLLLRMAAGATIPAHSHDGPEESLILEGDLRVGNQVLGEGDYQFAPAGSFHQPLHSENGCLALLIVPMRAEAVK